MNKKILALFVGLLAVGGISYAAWTGLFSGTSTMNVDSGVDFSYTDNLKTEFLDVSDSAKTISHDVFIQNDVDAILSFRVNFVTSKTDVEDTCTDWNSDCTISVKNGIVPIADGDVIELPPFVGRSINIEYSCVQFSCPQELSCDLTVQPL